MTATIIPLERHRNPDPALLIADCGHPNWPGWWLIMFLALAAQGAALLQLDTDQLRPRPGGVSRVVRPPLSRSARARRDHTTRARRDQKTAIGGFS